MNTQSLTLDYPPSANRYWRTYNGRIVVSEEASAYKTAVQWLRCLNSDLTVYTGDVRVRINVYRPAKRRDLDNCLKVVLDALQGVVYENDSQVVEIIACRFDDKQNPRVEVEVSEI